MAAGAVRIERIVSHGHASREGFWYDRDRDEWVVVLRGRAILRFEGDAESLALGPGDHVNIPAHRGHLVE
jgi:cupin 2 domain-containing protein